MSLLAAAIAIEEEARKTRSQIEAERSDGINKLVLLAEFTALIKVARALRAASVDGRRMAETTSGSVRSTTSAVGSEANETPRSSRSSTSQEGSD